MIRLLNKLPGFIRTPPGVEWILFKRIPIIFLVVTIIPCLPMLDIYLNNTSITPMQQKIIYQCLGALFSLWFLVGAIAIGCFVVMLMKGPAYVADPYELPKEEKRLEGDLAL